MGTGTETLEQAGVDKSRRPGGTAGVSERRAGLWWAEATDLSPPQVPTKCEPGCVCAKGLYENPSGECVPPEQCPCDFAGASYPGGTELHTDCKTW